jgi:uncharacterized protein DUF6851/vanadium-dependent haloperoxidase-like protein
MIEREPLDITRRTALKWGALAAAAPALGGLPLDVLASGDSVVLSWNEAALQGVRDSKLGPPMVARALAIVHTCIFDAWAAYDHRAVGTRLGGALKRPPSERTLANINMAISFAAYRAAVDLLPGDRVGVFDPLMRRLGYDPANTTTDITTPAGVGNVSAGALLDFRHRDGANQLGDEPGGKPGVAYADYTGYASANAPMDLGSPFDPATVHDPNRWQPLRYVDASGAVVTQAFAGAQWQQVTPFALTTVSQLRSPTGPARYGSAAYESQLRDLLALSAGLTDEQKMIAEYWADGPRSELPPGHWNLFAQFVSRRDHHGSHKHGVEADVTLFFMLTNAIFDASLCCWDNKRAFDSIRPISAIRYALRGQQVRAWGGPYQGTRLIDGAAWLPYQASTFPTPPFAEYSSGHSTFSAAGAEILRRFTGSDRFGASARIPPGSSKFEAGTVPAGTVILRWPRFSDAANQAGLSRRYGGIHFEQADLDGRAAGRRVAQVAWAKAQRYISGRTR